MARHYTNKDFFRQMPNALLVRYFHELSLFQDLDFTVMKEGNPAALFEAWLLLPNNQRNAMDAVFLEIFEMSCEKSFTAIIDEVGFQFKDNDFAVFVEKLSALPNHYQQAMINFLDHGISGKVLPCLSRG